MQADAYLIDRRRVYSLAGADYYTLRAVVRHGSRLRLPNGRYIPLGDDMVFIPGRALPPTALRNGSHLLLPVDDADGGSVETVPWQDLPERAKRTPRSRQATKPTTKEPGRPATRKVVAKQRWPVVQEWPQLWAALAPVSEGEPPDESPKATLLAKAIDLAEGSEADGALQDVVEAALEAGLPHLALSAVKRMRGRGEWSWALAWGINEFLEERSRWPLVDQHTAKRWEGRMLAGTGDESWRSRALARLGLRRLIRGEFFTGIDLWNAAPESEHVDAVISQIALECAGLGWTDWAMVVAEAIEGRNAKASTFAKLAQYV